MTTAQKRLRVERAAGHLATAGTTGLTGGAPPGRPAPPSELPAHTGEYSIFGLTRTVDQAVVRERQVGFTLLVLGVATVVGVLYALERYWYQRFLGEPAALGQLVPAELLFTYLWAVLTPGVLFIARRYPVWGVQRVRNWAVQVAAMIAFIGLHTALVTAASVALGILDISNKAGERSLAIAFGRDLLSSTVVNAVVFCLLVAVHHAVVYYRVSKDRALRASQLEARLAQAQLQMLRMQLQPHFLFNTLHSISSLMHKDVRRADSMIAALSELLRMSLRNIGAQEVPLQTELDFVEAYFEIMKLRFGERLRVVVDVEPEARDARVPNLFLQPLVENSLRHGFGDVGGGTIAITVRREGALLRCDVADDGRGLPAVHREGVGLTTTRQRLRHLYGDRQAFAVHSTPGEGARVTMTIPFHLFESTAAD